ncbi:replication/maintenance protein RepL [Shewanella sp. ZOR0012]|uniref:replication/maintenance protein RepL n=1 Tax=Shewanella sp. ZOR0012 TaxID=1339231 RepID=UPI000648E58D|nr:replication/maintenance protein RepL [Shewanella sp. ZOR0012]NSM24956.1 replication/maintenance protein RepL [Shewanella sp. ZOR0012]
MKRINSVKITTITDKLTGEVLNQTEEVGSTFWEVRSKINYVTIIFGEFFDKLSIQKPIEFKIFVILSQYISNDDSNSIDLSRNVRWNICKKYKINNGTLANTLTVLRREDIIRDGKNGVIYVNPDVAYKGHIKAISKAIKFYNKIDIGTSESA